MLIVTINEVPGKKLEALGVVRGSTVQSRNLGHDLMAGFRTLVGGEVVDYADMLTEARQIATGRMVKDAEAHAEEDKKQKEEVEARNQTDSLCYSTEQTLNELGDKVSADVKSKAEAAIADAKKALEGSDIDAIKSAGDNLQSVAYELAQMVYADAQQASAADGSSSDDDVVDADYEVVDDDSNN